MNSPGKREARHHVVLAPPPCPGVEQTRALRDAPALARLSLTRFTHATRKAPTWSRRLLYGYLTVIAALTWPVLLLPWCIYQVRDPRRTTYIHRDDRGRIVVGLTIKTGPGPTWTIGDHVTRRPGTGAGRHLRAELIPTLLEVADTHGITIQATAATGELAATYRREVPGLADAGAHFPIGRTLLRAPRT